MKKLVSATVGAEDEDDVGVGGEVVVGWADGVAVAIVGVKLGAFVTIITMGTPTSTIAGYIGRSRLLISVVVVS